MRAIGYTRVSTDEQATEGVSLDAQEAMIWDYAALNGLEMVGCVVDKASGKNLQRDGMKKLIQLCQEKAVDHVIVYKLDRLTRKTKDLLYLMEDVFLKNAIEFHSITEKMDTTSPTGKFFITLMASLSQLERDLISERTKDALAYKKNNGERLGPPVFGMHVVDGKLIPNKLEIEMAAYAASLRKQGLSLQQIGQKMTKRGFMPKRADSWSISSLHYLVGRGIAMSNVPPPTTWADNRLLETNFTESAKANEKEQPK